MRALDQLQELRRKARVTRKNLRQRGELLYAMVNPFIRECYPEFLCIGAPRTGTTWLYSTLKKHPDVFLPWKKELHFFDEPIIREWHGKRQNINICPYGRYFNLENPSDWRWYSLQFRAAGKRITGDITPGYSRLSDERVKLVSEKLPHVRIIFIMREPVQRAWSGVRNFALRRMRKRLDQVLVKEIMDFTMHPRRLMGGDYSEIIPRWEHYFKQERILYLFYDDLVSDPLSLANKVCEFLSLDPDRLRDREAIKARVNAADQEHDMPDVIRDALSKRYRGQIEFLEARFGRDLSAWKG